jgi:hypothetical protein
MHLGTRETGAAELAPTEAVRAMLDALQPGAARPFSADAGERLWYEEAPSGRSCTSCHLQSPQVMGRHHKTGEPIDPMARSVNPERLTDPKTIRKWLLRNCKWTYGRECTAQEQGDVLVWLSGQ